MNNVTFLTFLTFLALILASTTTLHANDLGEAIDVFDHRDYQDARDRFEVIAQNNEKDPEVLFYLAVTQFRTGELDDASDTLENLLKINPDHVDGHYLDGVINMALLGEVSIFRKLGVAKSALNAWKKIVEIQPDNALGQYAVFSFLMQAPGMAGGDKDEAKIVLKSLEGLDSPFAELAKGMIADEDEVFDEAEKHYINATKFDESQSGPFFPLAQFYFKQESYEQALGALAKFEAGSKNWNDPVQAVTHYYRGTTLAKMGDIVAARSSFNLAMAELPNKRMKGLIEDALEEL